MAAKNVGREMGRTRKDEADVGLGETRQLERGGPPSSDAPKA